MRAFPAERRGLALGMRMSGLPIGGAAAALLIPGLATIGGWRLALAGVGGLCGLFGLLCLLLPSNLRGEGLEPQPGVLRALLSDPSILAVTAVASCLVIGQFAVQGFLPLFLIDRHGWTAAAAASMLAFVHLGGITGRLVWGFLADRAAAGRRK